MRILQILARRDTNDPDTTLQFYEHLAGTKAASRFAVPAAGLERARVQDILIIAGSDEALRPFRSTNAPFLVDSIEEYHRFLLANGGTILRPPQQPQQVPSGINTTVRHPDSPVVEYAEHRKNT